MTHLFPEIEPYEQGALDVGDGQRICWEACGNPFGKPAVVLQADPALAARPTIDATLTRASTGSYCSTNPVPAGANLTRAIPPPTCRQIRRITSSRTSNSYVSISVLRSGSSWVFLGVRLSLWHMLSNIPTESPSWFSPRSL